ncbi:MAG TPA: hypothetical protein VMV46_02845 [Thermoanaerobaculia bacterium]|nr:hypothetical protein [Thermoanaerobaculia bacterium]
MTARTVLLALACLVPVALPAAAQPADHSDAAREAMAPMQWWVGRWEGEGWVMTPDRQRRTMEVVETVEARIDGQVLVFEGVGTDPVSGRVGHHALGVLSWDGADGAYRMRTFRSGGVLDPDVEVRENGTLVWGFPQGTGRVRFTITHTEDDRWVELGELSPDGEQWFPMLGMDLRRAEPPGAP